MTHLPKTILLALVLVCLAFQHVSAEILPYDPVLFDCKPTPQADSEAYPGAKNVLKSNKPARPPGKADFPYGQLVYLSGVITDEKCVPISGAIIDIWQTDRNGRYRYADKGELVNPYPVFAGTGRAISDNLGRYSFLTIFPGPYETFFPKPKPGHYELNAPHIHFHVTHEDFGTLVTKMYFEGDSRNDNDPSLRRLSEEIRRRLSAEVHPRSEAVKGRKRGRPSPIAMIQEDDPRFVQLNMEMRDKITAQVRPMDPNDPNAGLLAIFNITLRGKSEFKRF